MGDLLGLGFAALGIAAVVLLASVRLRGDWRATAVLVVVISTLTTSTMPLQQVVIPIASVNVRPSDLLVVHLIVIVASRTDGIRTLSGVLLGLSLLAVLSWLRGVGVFGFQAATNGSRATLLLILTTAFAAAFASGTAGRDPVASLRTLWLWSGVALSGLAMFRTALGPVEALVGVRVLTSSPALIVAQSAVLAATHTDPRWRRSAPILFGVVLLSRQTTVWVALIAMLIVALLLRSTGRWLDTGEGLRTGPLLLFGSGALIWVLAGPASVREGLLDAFQKLTFASGTGAWRLRGWVSLLDQYRGSSILDQLFGLPAGTVLARRIGQGELGGLVTVSAHNMYVQTLLTLGALGLILLVVLVLLAWRGSLRGADAVSTGPLVVGIAAFGLGYEFPAEQSLWLGALAASGLRAVRSRDDGDRPEEPSRWSRGPEAVVDHLRP